MSASRPRRVLLVSPREPSGVTWAVNCLLELGVRCYRKSADAMWREESGASVLREHEGVLRQYLPALSDHASFRFEPGLEVEWTHDWPTAKHAGAEALLWVRDPRDALLSRHAREHADLGLAEFLDSRDTATLLPRVAAWCLFTAAWREQARLGVLRFEDYKRDAAGTLRALLERLGRPASEAEIARAVEASSFTRAAAAEARYKAETKAVGWLVNRSGAVGGWQRETEAGRMAQVGREAAPLLRTLGYAAPELADDEAAWRRYPALGLLPFFRGVLLPDDLRPLARQPDLALEAWARRLTWERVQAERHDVLLLTSQLAAYFRAARRPVPRVLACLAQRAGVGREYHARLFWGTGRLSALCRAGPSAAARELARRTRKALGRAVGRTR